MKKLIPISLVAAAAFAVLPVGTLFAQNLVGTWQGPMLVTDKPADNLRVVFKISATVSGGLKGDMYSIDNGGHALMPDVTLKGSAVRMPIPSIGATYIGTLNADGNSITGKWTGGGGALTLNLVRTTPETAWKIPEPPPPPKMMPPDANPGFEVATVKLTNPNQRGGGIRIQGHQFSATNLSVGNLLLIAYGMHPTQLIGAPDWIDKERYDVLGKPDVEGQPNQKQMQALIQHLLADRFSLRFHHEKRELSVYLMVVGKTGAKVTVAEGDPKEDPGMYSTGPFTVFAKNATMADFAGYLQRGVVDRPVLDQTGLTGHYDFGMVWRPEVPLGGAGNAPQLPPDIESREDIFSAIQQALGLKLEATKTAADVMVIDHLEKPSEN